MNERFVLGEGFAVARGVLRDGPGRGQCGWVGLTTNPASVQPLPLAMPRTYAEIVGDKVLGSERRRKYRLVLEVVEEAPEPGSKAYVERVLAKGKRNGDKA